MRLSEIGDISGIENLGPRRPLSFGAGNLCVIYGHNGSGKSGYTRLLKKVCGKPGAGNLKANVFQPMPAERKCRIGYHLAEEEVQVEWLANSAPLDDLLAVEFFDAEEAASYLTRESGPTYTPRSVALFEDLAAVCDRVKARLETEQRGLVSALPIMPSEFIASPAGTAYAALKENLDEAAVQQIIQWRSEDQQLLNQVTQRLKTDDPQALARTKRGRKIQIDQLDSLIREAAAALSEVQLAAVRSLRAEALTKRRIVSESAQVASAKLDGVGTITWQAMWEAARAYSQAAYPEQAYPVTTDALCVLCHQELSQEAQQRLQDFETFVQGTLEAEAKIAEKAYSHALEALPTIITKDQIALRCQAAGLTEDVWVDRLANYWDQVGKTCDALRGQELTVVTTAIVQPSSILDTLTARSEGLEFEAVQHDQDATNFDRAQAQSDKVNLEARQWTAQQSAAVHAEIIRLQKVAEYDQWKEMANSRVISIKSGEIAEKVITQAFVDRFNRELKAFGASRIRVELCKTRTEKGKALYKLQLKDAQTDKNRPELVLSDGERRIAGFAAFLANVTDQPHDAPIVFDDPVSSLDHDFEWCVAFRLARLAQKRQVLVFTHRLSLYGAMEDAAKKIGDEWKKQNLQQHCIESFSGIAGQPANETALIANTKAANNILLARLAEAKNAGEKSGADTYRNLAQGICSDFRKLLERTVEDDLLNQIVRRHRRSVTTDNRLEVLPQITKEDCSLIDDLMTKYSCYEHSQSSESPVFVPEEPELDADLQSLKAWRENFKLRPTGAST